MIFISLTNFHTNGEVILNSEHIINACDNGDSRVLTLKDYPVSVKKWWRKVETVIEPIAILQVKDSLDSIGQRLCTRVGAK